MIEPKYRIKDKADFERIFKKSPSLIMRSLPTAS